MVLEYLLRRSRELTRYRRPPLGLELDGFCQWLYTQGYSRLVIRSHISNISQSISTYATWRSRIVASSKSGMLTDSLASIFVNVAVSRHDTGLLRFDAG